MPGSFLPCWFVQVCVKFRSTGRVYWRKLSERADRTGLQTVLIASCALKGLEVVREAVAEDGHFAAMAHRAWDEGKSPTSLARVWVLHPL